MATSSSTTSDSPSTSGTSGTSGMQEAVSLLEKTVTLLKNSTNSNAQNTSTHERAMINYRRIYPGPSASNTTGSTWPGNQTSISGKISGKGKNPRFRFQPYNLKETWTHAFCVLADKDEKKVPTTGTKQELREAGLGQKTIIFQNKRGDFKHIQDILFKTFPKLQEAGGFEFYRQGPGKDLSFIKPPLTGYTIPFLKYDYGIKSAIIYVLPIQRHLSMDKVEDNEDDVDDSNVEKQECYNCKCPIALFKLREHLLSCSSADSPSAKLQDEIEDDFDDTDLEISVFETAADSNSDTIGENYISSLKAMFPLTPIEELQSTLDTSSGSLQNAIDKLLGPDYSSSPDPEPNNYQTSNNLASLLKEISPKSIALKRITVNRDCIFSDSVCSFKVQKFDFDQRFRITFENEPGIDGGGPMREYFSLLLKELVSPSAPVRLFEGQNTRLMPIHNTDALRGGLFKVAGRMIASSIINGCSSFPCLAPPIYKYLITGSVDEAMEIAVPEDIPDFEITESLREIETLEDFEQIPEHLSEQLISAGFTKVLTKDNKNDGIMSLMINTIISSRKAELDQFCQGLGPLLRKAQDHPNVFRPLFVHDPNAEKLDAKAVKKLLDMDDVEPLLVEYLLKYIDTKDSEGLTKLLMFCTGSSSIPPMGFQDPSKITVGTIGSTLPNANTCPMELDLPTENSSFEEFCKQMDIAINSQATGFGVA